MRWVRAHPRLWAAAVFVLIVLAAADLGWKNLREFTDANTGELSKWYWVKLAVLAAVPVIAWLRARTKRSH